MELMLFISNNINRFNNINATMVAIARSAIATRTST